MGRVSSARDRLIEAAIDLVWLHSYGSVGVDAICERADVRKGSFYHFFKSKDELVAASLQANWEARKGRLQSILSADVPPRGRFVQYFAYIYARQLELRSKYGRVVGCFYTSVGTECTHDSPLTAAKIKEVLKAHVGLLETSIRDAELKGALPRGDARARAKMLFAYVEGVLGQARIHDDPDMVKQLRQAGPKLLAAQAVKRSSAAPL
jgi:TetR/AcrR family transcriptional repressor of nem operon